MAAVEWGLILYFGTDSFRTNMAEGFGLLLIFWNAGIKSPLLDEAHFHEANRLYTMPFPCVLFKPLNFFFLGGGGIMLVPKKMFKAINMARSCSTREY